MSERSRPTFDELDKMTSREIVLRAAGDHLLFKNASEILERRGPDEDGARALVEAYEAGRAPAWLTAHLLGCLRVRQTYDVVRRILVSAQGSLAESYAGVAMVRIAGVEARGDLVLLLKAAPHRWSREGAAPLARAARAAVRAGTVRLTPRAREMLEERIAALLDA